VLSLREREFIEASKSIGATNRRIYYKELLPNLWAPILIYFTLNLPVNISAEAALSFLGVGVQSPTPTLGSVLTDAASYSTSDPMFFFVPGFTIFVLVLSFNLFGDGLRDALDPKSSR
jgi:peptide/nickel transport system permease protein